MKIRDVFDIENESNLGLPLLKEVDVIKDFPIERVNFIDFTSILTNNELFFKVICYFAEIIRRGDHIDYIVAIESRGFLIGSALSFITSIPLVLARKKGKLPKPTYGLEISKEYGTDHIEIQVSDIPPDSSIFIVDDLLATGGTLAMTARILKRYMKAKSVKAGVVFALEDLVWDSDLSEFLEEITCLVKLKEKNEKIS